MAKNSPSLEQMRASGRVLATVLSALKNTAKPGVSLQTLDKLAHKMIIEAGATPAFLGYNGFPSSICISINSEVVHGLPNIDKPLAEGQLVSFDCGVILNGAVTDAAFTMPIGRVSKDAIKLLEKTSEALYAGLDQVKAGATTGDIGSAIEEVAHGANLGVVKDYAGHGVGATLHEDPSIPNFGKRGTGSILMAGMYLAIEPMFVLGKAETEIADDGWTVQTVDRSLAAHFEHTVAVLENGYEILTNF